jgi:putative Mg2+ transporter-C (MgtC) family protein
LRTILIACTNLRFSIDHVDIEREGVFANVDEVRSHSDDERVEMAYPHKGEVVLCMTVKGKRPVSHLIARLSDIDGVLGVGTMDPASELE